MVGWSVLVQQQVAREIAEAGSGMDGATASARRAVATDEAIGLLERAIRYHPMHQGSRYVAVCSVLFPTLSASSRHHYHHRRCRQWYCH